MAPFINLPLGERQERHVLPEGEYELRVEAADVKESKNFEGQTNVQVRLSCPDEPNAKAIFHYIAGVGPTDDKEKANNKLNMAAAFLDALGVDYEEEGFEMEDLLGATGTFKLGTEEMDSGETANKIKLYF